MCWWFAAKSSGLGLVWNRADPLSVPGKSAPHTFVSTVMACVEGPRGKKTAIFGILSVPCLQKWHGQFYSDAGHTRSFTGLCRGLSLPGVPSSQGLLHSRGQTLEDSQCLTSVSPWEALLWPWLHEPQAITGCRASGASRAGTATGAGDGCLEGKEGAEGLWGPGLWGATGEAGLCWVFLAWLWFICSFHLLKARVTFMSEAALVLGLVNCFCFHS